MLYSCMARYVREPTTMLTTGPNHNARIVLSQRSQRASAVQRNGGVRRIASRGVAAHAERAGAGIRTQQQAWR